MVWFLLLVVLVLLWFSWKQREGAKFAEACREQAWKAMHAEREHSSALAGEILDLMTFLKREFPGSVVDGCKPTRVAMGLLDKQRQELRNEAEVHMGWRGSILGGETMVDVDEILPPPFRTKTAADILKAKRKRAPKPRVKK